MSVSVRICQTVVATQEKGVTVVKMALHFPAVRTVAASQSRDGVFQASRRAGA